MYIHHLADGKQLLPVWILDEAQNLPPDFCRDFPAFLNVAFDSRDLMAVWLVGHRVLAQTLERAPYAALAGRIQVHAHLTPVFERERFARLIEHGFERAGRTQTLLTDSGLEILRQASKGQHAFCVPVCVWRYRMGAVIWPTTCCHRPSSSPDRPPP